MSVECPQIESVCVISMNVNARELGACEKDRKQMKQTDR